MCCFFMRTASRTMDLRAVFGTAAVNDTTTPNDELWEQPT